MKTPTRKEFDKLALSLHTLKPWDVCTYAGFWFGDLVELTANRLVGYRNFNKARFTEISWVGEYIRR